MLRLRKNVIISLALLLCMTFSLIGAKDSHAAAALSMDATVKVNEDSYTITIATRSDYEITEIKYLYGTVYSTDNDVWNTIAKDMTGKTSITVKEQGDYSFRVTDASGAVITYQVDASPYVPELNAVWISYLEFKSTGYTEKEFRTHVATMFENVASMGMNGVIVHVRPFGDAMYPSANYPWSKYVSGTQGKDPGFDPLQIMIEEAHNRGLEFHAWLNPYRVTTANTDVTSLAASNPARKWLTNSTTSDDRNVISFGGNLYYNPAKLAVRQLIYRGVSEIVKNYDVDGIHFDDYFYPTLGNAYETTFDAQEYKEYVADATAKGIKNILSIANWRRRNINWLVSNVYSKIKAIDETVAFGISPIGNIDTLTRDDRYYVDIKTWMSKSGYVDYVCPQIYWSNAHSTCPFNKTVDRWTALLKNDDVSLYIGIPVYKAGSNEDTQFKNNTNVLADMVTYARSTESVSGFMYYRYAYFYNNVTKKAVNNLISIIPE